MFSSNNNNSNRVNIIKKDKWEPLKFGGIYTRLNIIYNTEISDIWDIELKVYRIKLSSRLWEGNSIWISRYILGLLL